MDISLILKTADTMDKIGEYRLADKLTKISQYWDKPSSGLWGKKNESTSVNDRVDEELMIRANDLTRNMVGISGGFPEDKEAEMLSNLRSLREPLTMIFTNDPNADVSGMDGDVIKKKAAELTNPDANESYINLEPTSLELEPESII